MSEQAPAMGGDGWAGLSRPGLGPGKLQGPMALFPLPLSSNLLPSPQLSPKDMFKKRVGRLPWQSSG